MKLFNYILELIKQLWQKLKKTKTEPHVCSIDFFNPNFNPRFWYAYAAKHSSQY